MIRPAWADGRAPPPKRRRLPYSFQVADELARARRERAATRIARFWRWRRTLDGLTDPLSLAPLRPKRTLRLVESAGAVHNYDVMTLTDYFLRSGRFQSPLTRRELTELELLRLQRKCPVVELRALLHSTYLARRAIEAVDYSLEIQRTTAQSEVGEALQLVLAEAEQSPFDANWPMLHRLLQNYDSALTSYAAMHGEDLATLCKVNADIARRRGAFCPEALLQSLCEIHEELLDTALSSRARRGSAEPSMAFARLISSFASWWEPWATA